MELLISLIVIILVILSDFYYRNPVSWNVVAYSRRGLKHDV